VAVMTVHWCRMSHRGLCLRSMGNGARTSRETRRLAEIG